MSTPAIVDHSWLLNRLEDSRIRVIDTRPPAQFLGGHIPGAANLPAAFLVGPSGDPASGSMLARFLGRLGIDQSHTVVAVDEAGLQGAALLIWILQHYGHDSATLLEGGITGWQAAGLPLVTSRDSRSAVEYPIPHPSGIVDITMEHVLRSRELVAIVDARSAEEYGTEAVDGAEHHIPGAVHVEWLENLRVSEYGYEWLDAASLQKVYRLKGVTPQDEIVVYCHAGPRAAVSYVALKNAGFPNVRLYLRGWREWGEAARANMKVEKWRIPRS